MHRSVHIMSLCLAAASIALCVSPDSKKKVPERFRVVGYLPDYRMSTIHNSWGRDLTDIIYFSISPKASGEFDTSKLNEKAIRKLQALAKQNKVRILICIGGWGKSKGFGPMATNENRRRNFIRDLTKFCRKHGFAGADFDWEFPKSKAEKEAYSILLTETKNAFKPHGMIVTVAVGQNKQLTADAYQAVDYVHLMSYDHGVKHATYADSVADVKRQLGFGVPKEKLCLGVPFYGRNIKNRDDARTYSEIVSAHHPAPSADQAGGIYFNGVTTIQKKTRYAIENELAGVMIWEIGQDTFDTTSLLGAIKRTVSDAEAKKRSKNPGEQEN